MMNIVAVVEWLWRHVAASHSTTHAAGCRDSVGHCEEQGGRNGEREGRWW